MTDTSDLPALQDLRHQFERVAQVEPRRATRRRPRRAVIAVAAMIVLAVPTGFAIAQITDNDAVPANDCPDANAALRQAGRSVPDQYGPGCPTPEQIHKYLDQPLRTPPPPPSILRQAEREGRIHEGQDPSTYPPDVKQAIDQWRANHPGGG